MNCDRCGQRVNEVPARKHRFVRQAADGTLRCTYCGHNFGPVRELIEKAGLWNLYGSSAGAAELIATLTRERDEAMKLGHATQVTLAFAKEKVGFLELDLSTARARIAELEKPRSILDGLRDGESIVVRLGGTWEWRKVGE